jgi:hypothetical protein
MAHGPKLEREQILLGRFVEIGTDLFAIAASCSRAQYFLGQGYDRSEVLALVDHFCLGARKRIDDNFSGIRKNHDQLGYKLAQRVLAGMPWLYGGTVARSEPSAAQADEEPTEQHRTVA